MITPIKTMTISQIVARQDDLLVSVNDLKKVANNERVDAINEVISLIKSHRHYFIAPTLQKEIIEDLEELKEQNR